jgi:hypothetical protein
MYCVEMVLKGLLADAAGYAHFADTLYALFSKPEFEA